MTTRNPLAEYYPAIRERIAAMTPRDWPGLAGEIERHITQFDLPYTLLLPVAACAAAGGEPSRAISSAASIGFLLLSTRWFDDSLDRDRHDGLWSTVGGDRSMLFGASALALAFRPVTSDPETPREVIDALARHIVELAKGEDMDLTGDLRSFDEYWGLMRAKAGAAFALACEMGAILAGSTAAVVEACAEFGMHLGILLQVLDDLEGCFRPNGKSDLQQGKVTLPVVYGLQSDHRGRRELEGMVRNGNLSERWEQATEILDAAGARQYLVWAALQERKRAVRMLNQLPKLLGDTGRAGQDALASYLELPFLGLPELRGQNHIHLAS